MSIESFNGTLTTISFYILLAVADRPLHAYGIPSQIVHDSAGELIVAVGTLYPALKQIEAVNPPPGVTYRYRITPRGKRRLAAEAARHQRIAIHARYKLGEKIF